MTETERKDTDAKTDAAEAIESAADLLMAETKKVGEQIGTTLQKIKENVREDDPKPSPTLTLRKILGGDILNADLVRRQLWLIVLIVLFTIAYVAFRYQCQQDMIAMDKLENELKDAKYKALSSSSTLTERCRESHVLNILKNNADSTLHMADQPPYIINVPEEK